jgi:hypothetical protein
MPVRVAAKNIIPQCLAGCHSKLRVGFSSYTFPRLVHGAYQGIASHAAFNATISAISICPIANLSFMINGHRLESFDDTVGLQWV